MSVYTASERACVCVRSRTQVGAIFICSIWHVFIYSPAAAAHTRTLHASRQSSQLFDCVASSVVGVAENTDLLVLKPKWIVAFEFESNTNVIQQYKVLHFIRFADEIVRKSSMDVALKLIAMPKPIIHPDKL